MQALVAFVDEDAEREIRRLRAALAGRGIGQPEHRFAPHLTLAAGAAIPSRARAAVRDELALLALPGVWLSSLAVLATAETALVLAAVVDTELIAVHSAVHDALAGKVRHPAAAHLPGSWIPHCTLADRLTTAGLGAAITALHPVTAVRARLGPVAVLDTSAGTVEPLPPR